MVQSPIEETEMAKIVLEQSEIKEAQTRVDGEFAKSSIFRKASESEIILLLRIRKGRVSNLPQQVMSFYKIYPGK